MINCSHCNSENVTRNGAIMRGREKMAKLKCSDCGLSTYISDEVYLEINAQEYIVEDSSYVKEEKYIQKLTKAKKLVVTCAVMGHEVNETFFETLENYCAVNKAQLVVIPIKYRNTDIIPVLHSPAEKYYIQNNFDFGEHYKIMGALRLNASMENPLAGLDPLSKGKSIVFGHPQVALKTVSTDLTYPAIISTTGCITEKSYTETKQGFKATFNHSHSAVILENDKSGNTHLRHLNFDGDGFYDLTHYYDTENVKKCDEGITALVTGDEHVLFQDKTVAKVTYTNKDSIVETLRPTYIVRHDVLDCYSVSHHHKHNVFTQYAKFKQGYAKIQDELEETIEFIKSTTPEYATSIIISSNHNDHLLRWLNECDPKIEPWNAEIYHWFMHTMLRYTRMGESGAEYPNPFELYFLSKNISNVEFLDRNSKFMIHDVSIVHHGDVGTNGSRGSRKQFSALPTKTIIGHSHSPGITHGCYQVGTSSNLQLEYNIGPSSWHHAHCLVYPNGKRQLIFIINGQWKA